MHPALFVLLGLVAGAMGGLFGIGGGIVIVPALVLAAGFSQQMAQGTSMVALLAPVGIFGLLNYYRNDNADLFRGGLIALGFLAGAYFGSKLALSLDEALMRRLFSILLMVVGAYMFFRK